MSDLISRQAAIDAMWKIRRQKQMIDDTHKADMVMHGIHLAEKALEQLPSAEPVRHGKWIKADSQQYFRKHYPCFTCSECGYRKDSQKKWNYCPHCGARMDAE